MELIGTYLAENIRFRLVYDLEYERWIIQKRAIFTSRSFVRDLDGVNSLGVN